MPRNLDPYRSVAAVMVLDRRFYVRMVGMQGLMAAFSIVWLAVPFAFWQAFGFWWMLAWLLPTTAGVFFLIWSRMQGGG